MTTRTIMAQSWLVAGTALMLVLAPQAQAESRNPCAMKNPCATQPAHPCAAKAANPCAAKAADRIDPRLITRPVDYRPYRGDPATLVKHGERLFKDSKLSSNGLSCQTCHQGGQMFGASFAQPYPHRVAMANERAGVKKVHLDEMVQACLLMPMAARPLPWESRELAALTAYTASLQKDFRPEKKPAANPCAVKTGNPCAAKNPCAVKPANPCAPRR